MKIDLLVHAKERSACGKASESEIAQAAIEAGLDAIVFTDHDKLIPKNRLNKLNRQFAPLQIFGGIEVSIRNEHIIVLGLDDKKLETEEWTYPKLHKFCRKNDGFMILAHPYRFNPDIELNLEKYPPDAVELYSANTPLKERNRIVELASKLNLIKVSNSDAHITSFIGKYFNILDHKPADEKELIKMLKKGKFTRAAFISEAN